LKKVKKIKMKICLSKKSSVASLQPEILYKNLFIKYVINSKKPYIEEI
jgi:hypothetical protein